MPKAKEITVSAAELGGWLGLSTKTIATHAASKVLVRAERGRYELQASVRNYCEHLRKSASGRNTTTSAEKARLTKTQADVAEFKFAVQRGLYLLASETESNLSNTLRLVRAGMLTVPSQISVRVPDLPQDIINEIYLVVRDVLIETATKIGDEA